MLKPTIQLRKNINSTLIELGKTALDWSHEQWTIAKIVSELLIPLKKARISVLYQMEVTIRILRGLFKRPLILPSFFEFFFHLFFLLV
jgi:hypothetical protein